MAIVTGTYETFQTVGIKEDLSEIIANIAPTETPALTMFSTANADNTFPEWQTDSLDTAADNAQLEGDEATFTAATPTQRLGNRTQISRKTIITSGSNEKVDAAGRGSEHAYQIMKKGKELKRDIEKGITGKSPVTAGVSDTTARTSGGMELWITTNVDSGAGYADVAKTAGQPDNAAALTDGTQRIFEEQFFKSVSQQCWTQGGDPTVLMVGPFNRRKVSGFTGNATRMIDAEASKLNASIDLYTDDFGNFSVVKNRFSRDRTALVIDPTYWDVRWLRPIFKTALAKTGDADKDMLLGEWTLASRQEAASGKVADLTTA